MRIAKMEVTKLCHIRPGDCVRLLKASGDGTGNGVFMVVHRDRKDGTTDSAKKEGTGLYGLAGELFLVNLETGELLPMPHLSARVVRADDVVLVIPM